MAAVGRNSSRNQYFWIILKRHRTEFVRLSARDWFLVIYCRITWTKYFGVSRTVWLLIRIFAGAGARWCPRERRARHCSSWSVRHCRWRQDWYGGVFPAALDVIGVCVWCVWDVFNLPISSYGSPVWLGLSSDRYGGYWVQCKLELYIHLFSTTFLRPAQSLFWRQN